MASDRTTEIGGYVIELSTDVYISDGVGSVYIELGKLEEIVTWVKEQLSKQAVPTTQD